MFDWSIAFDRDCVPGVVGGLGQRCMVIIHPLYLFCMAYCILYITHCIVSIQGDILYLPVVFASMFSAKKKVRVRGHAGKAKQHRTDFDCHL